MKSSSAVWECAVQNDAPGILSNVRVVEYARGIAAPLAAMQLAEAGAEVIKVEPPGGDPTRARPGFAVWNRSKQSVVLDLDTRQGDDDFDRLLGSADVLVHDLPAAEARGRGWDAPSLAVSQPGLIVCGVPPYPAGHADEDRPGNDTLVLARLGLMDEQRGHRPGPVFIRFPLGSFFAAWLAANGVLARLIARDRTGQAGAASTSLLQGALVPMTMHWAHATQPGPSFALGMPKENVPSLFECGDGRWIHVMASPDATPLMQQELASLGEARIAALDAAEPSTGLNPHTGANRVAFKRHPSTRWLEELWGNDVPVQPAVPLGEIYFDEQAIANDYVIDVEDPALGSTRQPGPPYTTEPPARVRSPAPRLGADTERVLAAPPRARRLPAPSGPPEAAPLAGVRVVDFGNFLAGPLAPMFMSDLGADVIKVEATGGDPMRRVARVFDGCQRGKRGVALDLKDPRARSALERIVASADVVHHNLRMPAARRLGLDYETLSKVNPDLVYCHVSSYGPRGPRADWPGFDQLFQAQSGWEYEGAGQGNPPLWHRFGMMDHQCALASLFATLLAIRQRDATGRGQCVAASLLGTSILTVSETVVLPDGSLAPFERLDAEQMGLSPAHRLFVCEDGWIAVHGPSASALRQALSLPADAALVPALASMPCETALAALVRAGIGAERVAFDQMHAFLDDPRNRAMALSVDYPHTAYGQATQIGSLWQLEPARPRFPRAAPVLGEHTREVLQEAGLSVSEVEALLASGAARADDGRGVAVP